MTCFHLVYCISSVCLFVLFVAIPYGDVGLIDETSGRYGGWYARLKKDGFSARSASLATMFRKRTLCD